MNKIIEVTVHSNFVMLLRFNDGISKQIDFTPLIGEGISAALLDEDYFKKVSIDNGGGIEWPNGMDFCPVFLRDYQVNNEAIHTIDAEILTS